MTAIQQNIIIEQGTDYEIPFTLTELGGNPVNLTGAAAVMQIRTSYGASTAIVTLSTADGSLVINGRAGTITPYIEQDVTSGLTPGIYVYDIKMLETDGRISRPFQGSATISPQVTTIPVPAPAPAPAPAPSPSPQIYTTADGDPYTTADGDPYTT